MAKSDPASQSHKPIGASRMGSMEFPARENLQKLIEQLKEDLGADRISVSLNESDGFGLHMRVLGECGLSMPKGAPTPGTGRKLYYQPEHKVLRERTVANDLEVDGDSIPMRAALLTLGIQAVAKLPLVVNDEVVGSLNIGSRTAGFFTDERLDRAEQCREALATIAWHALLVRWHQEQSDFLSVSQQLIQALSSPMGIRDTCRQLSKMVAHLLDVDRVSVYLVNEDRTWLTTEAITDRRQPDGEEAQLLPGLSLEEPSMLTETLADKPLTVLNPAEVLDLPDPIPAQFELDRMRSLLVIPLMHGQDPVGILFAQRLEAKPILAPDSLSTTRLLGRQLGLMLHGRRLNEHQEQSAYNFTELLNMSHAVSSAADITQLPELVATQARDLCHADESTLCLLEPDGVTLKPVVCLGEWSEQVLEARIRVGKGITGTVAARRKGELINRAELDPRSVQIPGTPLEPEAILAVPLICADRLVGALALHKLEGRVFNPVDLDTLEIFASQAAVAIENARLIAGIREERTRLVTMLQHMEEGVIFVDREGLVLLINHAARRMLNLNGEEPQAQPAMEVLQGPDYEVLRGALARIQDGEERNVTEEYTLRGRVYLASVSAVHDGESESRSGEVLLFKDVTDLKEIEAQLLQSSKMSAVGQLAAGVAHEFNNLNASIYGYAQFMQEHQDPKVIQKGVDIILKSSERARELTSSLLTFSRRRPGRREPVDINQILTDTLLLLHRQFEKAQIKVERDTGRIPLTVADPGKLQQVVLNVLINAQQAMTDGGALRVISREQGGFVELVVEDTGKGIDPEHLPRIFEPFFTTKGPLSGAKTPGVGLGLSSAYNIVRDHGGTINATSRPGEGTTFSIRIPVRSLKEPDRSPGGPRPPRSLEVAGRILIVDENPALSGLIAEILENMGHRVTRADDASQATRHLADEPCDLLIVDHTAPGNDAVDLYRNIRRRSAELPVVFVTNRTAAQVVEAEGDPWVFRINKPFRNRDLVSLASRALTQSLRRAG